jgi:hypothetical protein
MRATTALTFAGAGVFALAMASLHVLRPDISPFDHGMSRYAGGDTIVLATVGFVALAIALLALRASLPRRHRSAGNALSAAAGGLFAVAATPIGNQPTRIWVEAAHSVGGLTFYLGATGAMFLTAAVATDRFVARLMSVALALFLLGGAGTPGLHPFVGLLQRAVFAIAIYWIAHVALQEHSDDTRAPHP